jgi:hypothetical protein
MESPGPRNHELNIKVDEPILVGRLKWRPTLKPKMVMKETENCLTQPRISIVGHWMCGDL